MECLFCEDLRNCKPELGKGIICSRCFWVLDSVDQDYLKQLYSKSIEEGNARKAKLVTYFLTVKDSWRKHERKTKEPKRDMGRKRPMRKIRPDRTRKRP